MNIAMNDERIVSIAQSQEFLKGVDGAVTFSSETKGNKNKQKMYEWVGRTLGKFRYGKLKKKEKGIVIKYLRRVTKLSVGHLKKLIARKKKKRTLRIMTDNRHAFGSRYGTSDITRLINQFYRENIDEYLNFHQPCGFATERVDSRGKIVKVYDTYLTPYEKLISLPDFEHYIKKL